MKARRSIFALIAMGIVTILAVPVFAATPVTTAKEKVYYVNDYADIISAEDEKTLIKVEQDLQKKTGIAVITVTTKNGYTSDQLGLQLINKVFAWNLETGMKGKYIVVGVDSVSKAIYTLPSAWCFQYMSMDQIKNVTANAEDGDPQKLVTAVITLVNSSGVSKGVGDTFTLTKQDASFYVNDQANLLTAAQKAALLKTSTEYSNSKNIKIIFVTTTSLRGGTGESMYTRIKAKWDLPSEHVVIIYDKATSRIAVHRAEVLDGYFSQELRAKINKDISSSKNANTAFTTIAADIIKAVQK